MSCDFTTMNLCARAGDRNETTLMVLTEGDPTDLTGAVATAQARVSVLDPDPALTATVTAPDPAQGIFTVAWDGDDVRALLAAGPSEKVELVWDLNVVRAGETLADTPCGGRLECVMDVTRAPDVVVMPVPEDPLQPQPREG